MDYHCLLSNESRISLHFQPATFNLLVDSFIGEFLRGDFEFAGIANMTQIIMRAHVRSKGFTFGHCRRHREPGKRRIWRNHCCIPICHSNSIIRTAAIASRLLNVRSESIWAAYTLFIRSIEYRRTAAEA